MVRSLSIIIPAFNEEARLPKTIENVLEWVNLQPFEFSELLIVDDGSSDGTVEVAESYARRCPHVRILRNPGNRGKGFSVRHGMQQACGDWRLFSDADLSAPIEETTKLIDAVESRQASVAIGSRALNRALIGVHQPPFRETAGKFFNWVMKLFVGLPFEDTQCGFKLFSRDAASDVFSRQQIERFGFDVEILFIARLNGFKIVEVPVRWSHVEGTKVSLWSGAQGFWDLLVVRAHQFAGRYR